MNESTVVTTRDRLDSLSRMVVIRPRTVVALSCSSVVRETPEYIDPSSVTTFIATSQGEDRLTEDAGVLARRRQRTGATPNLSEESTT